MLLAALVEEVTDLSGELLDLHWGGCQGAGHLVQDGLYAAVTVGFLAPADATEKDMNGALLRLQFGHGLRHFLIVLLWLVLVLISEL